MRMQAAAMQATGCECGLLPCHESNRLRMQAVAVPERAKHCSGKEARQGWSAALAGMSEMQLRANAGLLH